MYDSSEGVREAQLESGSDHQSTKHCLCHEKSLLYASSLAYGEGNITVRRGPRDYAEANVPN